jgi:hypothetical protein
MKECEPLAAPTTYTRVDEELEMELEGPEIAVDVLSFDVLIADLVVLDPVPELNGSAEVGAAPEVGEVSEAELCPVDEAKFSSVDEAKVCPVAVFGGLLISLFVTQHDGVPSGW